MLNHHSCSPILQTHHAAGVMTIPQQFGLGSLGASLQAAGGVHKLFDLLSLQSDMHIAFDRLNPVSFEATDKVRCLDAFC